MTAILELNVKERWVKVQAGVVKKINLINFKTTWFVLCSQSYPPAIERL